MVIRERVINDNPYRLVSHTVLKEFPTWQTRECWLNKFAANEEDRLFAAFNEYGEYLLAAITRIILNTAPVRPRKS